METAAMVDEVVQQHDDTIRGLSTYQMRFLAARLTTETDKQACLKCGLAEEMASKWKARSAEFRAAYDAIWTDGIKLAQDYARKLLGESVATLEASLTASGEKGPDWRARNDAAKTLLTIHGVLRQRVDVNLVRDEAKRLAEQYGLDEAAILAEAEQVEQGRGSKPTG